MHAKNLLVATALALLAGANVADAQTTPAAPAAAAPAPSAKAAKAGIVPASEKAAVSAKCSAEANTQGLKGKARKSFRSKCKRGKT